MAGVSQPSPLTPARQRAQALADSGDLTGAIALLERAVELGKINLAEDDPDVLRTSYLLGQMLRRDDDLSGARRVLEDAYAAGLWRLGDSDALMLEISHDIGVVAEELGNRHEARKAFGRVAELGPATLGVGHWAVARARAYLGQDQDASVRASEPARPQSTPSPAVPVSEPPTIPTPVAPRVQSTQPASAPPGRPTSTPPGRPTSTPPDEQPQSGPPVRPVPGDEPTALIPTQPTPYEEPTTTLPIPAWGGNTSTPAWDGNTSTPAWGGNTSTPAWDGNTSTPAWDGNAPTPSWDGNAPTPAWTGNPQPPAPQWPGRGSPAYAQESPPSPKRSLGIFAAIAAVLAAVIAVSALVFVLANRSGDKPDSDVPTLGGEPPTGVTLKDQGARIRVTWTDPAAGGVSFLVAMAQPGQQLSPVGTLGPGTTSFEIGGLNANLNYCFAVVAVYRNNKFATSQQACTNRPTSTK
jgi:hypothetical protein